MQANSAMVRLVVFDWAGTTIDHGCFAPLAAFIHAFAMEGILVTPAQARIPMGLHKRDHLREIARLPEIDAAWHAKHGTSCSEADIDRMFATFIPAQMAVLDQHSELIPGLLECVATLRQRGIRIGGSTGYFREAAERVRHAAARQGYIPDASFCPDDVEGGGRPAPWMIFRNMEATNVYPPHLVVKVGDTVPDMEEGRNAGVWTIGVTHTSSDVGCTLAEFHALSLTERERRIIAVKAKLIEAGAHAVIDSVAELPGFLNEIDARIANGQRP